MRSFGEHTKSTGSAPGVRCEINLVEAVSAVGGKRAGELLLRYQFPYMELRAKRPDPPQLAQATVRAAWPQQSLRS
jgi:predicted alpha/beta-hydrolase family hydrolase